MNFNLKRLSLSWGESQFPCFIVRLISTLVKAYNPVILNSSWRTVCKHLKQHTGIIYKAWYDIFLSITKAFKRSKKIMNLYDHCRHINIFTFSTLNSYWGFYKEKRLTWDSTNFLPLSTPPKYLKMFVGTVKTFYFSIGPQNDQLSFFQAECVLFRRWQVKRKGEN